MVPWLKFICVNVSCENVSLSWCIFNAKCCTIYTQIIFKRVELLSDFRLDHFNEWFDAGAFSHTYFLVKIYCRYPNTRRRFLWRVSSPLELKFVHRDGFLLSSSVWINEGLCIFDKDENCPDLGEIRSRVNSIRSQEL